MIIPVELKNESYEIVLGRGVLDKAGEHLNLERKALIVTDSGVPATYALRIADQCREADIVTVPAGENSKSLMFFQNLLSQMLAKSFTRKDCVVAVGGGVVGDLSGFAAACYMRGVDFYNIPTTLLSQVDSSIGGKTAVDLDGVKNIVGAFYQPKKVLIDPDVLKTLDKRQFAAGLAESIKMSVTSDKDLFELIRDTEDINKDIDTVIERSLLIKKDVVEKDPKENGLRKILNFGHTIGHAIESESVGRMLHGECVALGMICMCSEEVRKELKATLEKHGLPTSYSADASRLMPYILHDKKSGEGSISAVFSDSIGTYRMHDIDETEVEALLKLL